MLLFLPTGPSRAVPGCTLKNPALWEPIGCLKLQNTVYLTRKAREPGRKKCTSRRLRQITSTGDRDPPRTLHRRRDRADELVQHHDCMDF
jgi:hypothetical protein